MPLGGYRGADICNIIQYGLLRLTTKSWIVTLKVHLMIKTQVLQKNCSNTRN